jgi:hypothetical protein
MSQCNKCGWNNPTHGLNIDGWCIVCVERGKGIFIPYSGRKPAGDGGCPQCGWALDGVFLCRCCEEANAEAMRKELQDSEWAKHQADRWKKGYKPQDDVEWRRKMESLDEVARKYGLTPAMVRGAVAHKLTINQDDLMSWPEDNP